MWFVVSKKRYDHQIKISKARREQILAQDEVIESIRNSLDNCRAILKSSEREKVLADLERSLKLIQQYQRALSMIGASDPNILASNKLLEKYGLKGDSHATYLGATHHPLKSHWQKEEEKWGDEAYGSGYVRIEAKAIDEGDNKEPRYTQGRIQYFDLDTEDPPILAQAKATTNEASRST